MTFNNSKGVKWYLNRKRVIIGQNKQEVDTYYFSKAKGEFYCSEDLPIRYTVIELPNGLPVIKRK